MGDVESMYTTLYLRGLEYGPTYRTLTHILGSLCACKLVVARLHPLAQARSVDRYAAALDDAFCVSGISDANGKEGRIPFAVQHACLTPGSGGLWAISLVRRALFA